jgi:hypothetical protein
VPAQEPSPRQLAAAASRSIEINPDNAAESRRVARTPTLNEGFTMKTSEAEFRRVVRHEAGHTLGFDHEHMRSEIVGRIDRARAIAYFDRFAGWTGEEVDELTPAPTPVLPRTVHWHSTRSVV